ncbi:hypothetical protein [Roseovarius sp. ZX-A-9]|uniref:hypothetical protein n=1 Tax=Roseovarius sp. ZX-A-9 TaxID=3014783 RepID=UPI0023303664|nr:hypothetical protein [Roseovarius sp. ZX-A-9]
MIVTSGIAPDRMEVMDWIMPGTDVQAVSGGDCRLLIAVTGSTAVTAREFCAVIAVSTLAR